VSGSADVAVHTRIRAATEAVRTSSPEARCLRAEGKFLFLGDEKFYVRGVTYGTFRDGDGDGWPEPNRVREDFSMMVEARVNTVRTYAPPPSWVCDAALDHGLKLIIGLPWEQHIAFLDERACGRDIERRVRAAVRECAGHSAIGVYTVGNEIPASIVRWHGARRVERFLHRLYDAAKEEDPSTIVTYANYPSTEYLDLPFLDLVCFNVFLEEEEKLEAYLARLQNISGERPLIVSELGLDSLEHGEGAQAVCAEWQVRTAFRSGCAGAIVFSWTDEWFRGGEDVVGWRFGLTREDRRPKPGLDAVRQSFLEVPFPAGVNWPTVSVVVCTLNGAATLGDCLMGIARLDYPEFETIVVDDGSSDTTASIARAHDVRLIQTENRGLSAARNSGLAASTGTVVAYIDDDAIPDPQWLRYLIGTLLATTHAGVGGPNLPFPDDGLVADAVARTPGGPTHVLLTDRQAEHVPGCNMAFWRAHLVEVGSFDERFRIAGDDVDMCWRFQARGWTLGFSPAAVVWHHRRRSIRTFVRQQTMYGRAEGMLARKWPERYNRAGHLAWAGRLYGGRMKRAVGRRWRIYYGPAGTGLFQSVYQPSGNIWSALPLMPEWYALLAALLPLGIYELVQRPIVAEVPGLGLPLMFVLFVAALSALVIRATAESWRAGGALRLRATTTLLHVIQPLARLLGRASTGLTPWRRRGTRGAVVPRPRTVLQWDEQCESAVERLDRILAYSRSELAAVRRGGEFDRWDLEARTGPLGSARLRLAIEDHGSGKQLVRFRIWPRPSRGGGAATAFFLTLCLLALHRQRLLEGVFFGVIAFLTTLAISRACSAAVGICTHVVGREQASTEEPEASMLPDLDRRLAEARAQGTTPLQE
jgi:glycosyltransferase involved in cell wall biosynthesis